MEKRFRATVRENIVTFWQITPNFIHPEAGTIRINHAVIL